MRTCTKCGPTENEFPKRGNVCKKCWKQHYAEQYKKNKVQIDAVNMARYHANKVSILDHNRKRYHEDPVYRQAQLDRTRIRKESLKAFVDSKKDVPCADCGCRFPPICMDFDHLGEDKEECVSILVAHGVPLEQIQAEIEKCEAVCACCHRIRTATRLAQKKVA